VLLVRNIYAEGAAVLAAGEDLVMATIAGQKGSAPRTAGTKMLVCRDGSLVGTIGGGLLEAQVMDLAREIFATGRPALQHFSLTGATAESTDMICGGNLDVLVELWSPRRRGCLEICQRAAACINRRERASLVTRLPDRQAEAVFLPKYLLTAGTEGLPPGLAEEIRHLGGAGPVVVEVGGDRFLVEPLGNPGTVYIFGAGHVSQQLAVLTAMVDFRTVVLDDRAEFASTARFPRADELIVLDSFDNCLKAVDISADSYLVIVTRGHRHDLTVLEQALGTNARYVGMIGSRRKVQTLYRALREKGMAEEQLARVHAPIGLAIGAETPEEIAVSIVGELIAVRAGVGDMEPAG